eukprot:CAMPEP_0176434158 /NCGR_PEP_ID=MMETSP0127-20121128/16502_1 /TAXON_ID=938130 /ORGANISM="Platyophrya macrostoma, Strain WH" /LENGTH=225 /DNA_ID=CAMNT_0017816825 /DNA_START=109 /DNA_END=786 /DNA_ORIENTATION=+
MEADPKSKHMRRTKYKSVFLETLYVVLEDSNLCNVISWCENGVSFVIYSVQDFEQTVLPKFSRVESLSSFIKRLTHYNFRRDYVRDDKGVLRFYHPCFIRGRSESLRDIHADRVNINKQLAAFNTPVSEKYKRKRRSNASEVNPTLEGAEFESHANPTDEHLTVQNQDAVNMSPSSERRRNNHVGLAVNSTNANTFDYNPSPEQIKAILEGIFACKQEGKDKTSE